MARMTRIVVPKTNNYTVINNSLLRDKRLTFGARGMMATMLSLPPNWDLTVQGLSAISPHGPKAVRRLIGELADTGYMIYRQARESGGKYGAGEYVILETPENQRFDRDTQKPVAVERNAVIRNAANCPQLSKDGIKYKINQVKRGDTPSEKTDVPEIPPAVKDLWELM